MAHLTLSQRPDTGQHHDLTALFSLFMMYDYVADSLKLLIELKISLDTINITERM
jgi:hypothetical protein